MKKNLGSKPAIFPMPVLMVAAYDEDGKTDVLNAAWGMLCAQDKVALFISEGHKTTQNLLHTGAFTVSLADFPHMKTADFFGMVSGHNMEDKFKRSGFTAVKSKYVNAPVIEEFPVVMECELFEVVRTKSMYCIVGQIKNTAADESVLNKNGEVDPGKLNALIYNKFQRDYYVLGDRVGEAWSAGSELLR